MWRIILLSLEGGLKKLEKKESLTKLRNGEKTGDPTKDNKPLQTIPFRGSDKPLKKSQLGLMVASSNPFGF